MTEQQDHTTPDAPDDRDARIASLLDRIAHTGTLATREFTLPSTDEVMVVTRPTDANLLLDLIADDPEQNLPYWAEIWPSGVALAADIAQHPERTRGRRVLELGCGLGITAAVALRHGANLTATDYAEESLVLTQLTALRHTGREPERVQQVNWRGESLSELVSDGAFDVVLAADVLYERRDIEPLIAAMDTLLTPDGSLWLAEPGRKPAETFLLGMQARSWNVESTAWHGPWPEPEDTKVTVHTHWIRRL